MKPELQQLLHIPVQLLQLRHAESDSAQVDTRLARRGDTSPVLELLLAPPSRHLLKVSKAVLVKATLALQLDGTAVFLQREL